MSQDEFIRLKFRQGIEDVRRCEAIAYANGYNNKQWVKCFVDATPHKDIKARFIEQEYEGSRYQVQLSHLITDYRISVVPGLFFINEFRPRGDLDVDVACAIYELNCDDLRAIIAETTAQLHHQ